MLPSNEQILDITMRFQQVANSLEVAGLNQSPQNNHNMLSGVASVPKVGSGRETGRYFPFSRTDGRVWEVGNAPWENTGNA